MNRSTAIVATILAAALLAAAAPAQDARPEPAPDGLREEVARLGVIMKEIAGLLQKQVEGQETDLLIRRIELGSRSLEPRKERLRLAKASLQDLQDEEKNLARMLEVVEEEKTRQQDLGEREPYHELQLQQMADRLETIERRRQELRREVAELEGDVLVREQDQRLLEEMIDARLGLR